jgi:hypothetical protein
MIEHVEHIGFKAKVHPAGYAKIAMNVEVELLKIEPS